MKSNLRSEKWFGPDTDTGFQHRAALRSMGYTRSSFAGRPVIGICNSWSELNNCNVHLRVVADAVKRGVWAAGGLPLEFMTISLGEELTMPTTMLYRNLMAMDVEEMIRSNPVDGVVLLCGCDKTTPAQLMGAASMDVPAIMVPVGPMLSGRWQGQEIGSGTDLWKFWDERRVGRLSDREWEELESCYSRSAGTCNTMGTASTMTGLAEVLGMILPNGASIPAADSRRLAFAEATGRRIVEMVEEDLRPSKILTEAAFENAIRALAALGGSTNAVIHLIAIAGRRGIRLPLDLFDKLARSTPIIANLQPTGAYLMENLFYAGGIQAVIKRMLPLLHRDTLTATGKTIEQNATEAQCHNSDVIRPLDRPVQPGESLAVLYGNLAPNGAIIKASAASPSLLQHSGRAIVFNNYEEMLKQIDNPDLDVDESNVLVLRNAGPVGGPGMPEWGMIPLPTKLVKRGVKDMVRVSDARMSGTSFGTVVVHISPESARGGPLAAVRTGDTICLDVPKRRIDVLISDSELKRRMAEWEPAPCRFRRGYYTMFLDHVLQAHEGCDFDFLCATSDDKPYEPQMGRT
ncbi:MAG TPA: IlvD/Edd family dehydratase [Terriglobia bacterium]|jgi:dihydroxy-acid dehydratase|nr:IlvD/Edd family dehydratase [Terriglobia bacterium]